MFAQRHLRSRLVAAGDDKEGVAIAPQTSLERVLLLQDREGGGGGGGGVAVSGVGRIHISIFNNRRLTFGCSGIASILLLVFAVHTSMFRVALPLMWMAEVQQQHTVNQPPSQIQRVIPNKSLSQSSSSTTLMEHKFATVSPTTMTPMVPTLLMALNASQDERKINTISSISISTSTNINNSFNENNSTTRLEDKGNDLLFMGNIHKEVIPPFVNHSFRFDRKLAEVALIKWGAAALRPVLSAYLETTSHAGLKQNHHLFRQLAQLGDNKTVSHQEHDVVMQLGLVNDTVAAAEYEKQLPLPVRTGSPQDLLHFHYRQLKTCHDLPSKLPIDRGVLHDQNGDVIQWNLLRNLHSLNNVTSQNDTRSIVDDPRDCPVDVDPFLPWIHDIFPSLDGSKIHILTQNKRQCKINRPLLSHMTPQVALAQHVSVQRITHEHAMLLAPTSWHANIMNYNNTEPAGAAKSQKQLDHESILPRYRLVPHDVASPDGMDTRYICRFHGLDVTTSPPRWVVVGETLSTFPYSYEFLFYRTGTNFLYASDNPDYGNYHFSHFQFNCPVPTSLAKNQSINSHLPTLLASGDTILSDGTPTLALSIIPIRTPARHKERYLSSDYIGPNPPPEAGIYFNASKHWGFHHVLPQVEASGRWEFLPLCYTPQKMSRPLRMKVSSEPKLDFGTESTTTLNQGAGYKPYTLAACVWASAIYTSPNGDYLLTENIDRLIEWIEFHLMVGFDHIFIYDNSEAQGVKKQNRTTKTSEDDEDLSSIRTLHHAVSMFPPSQVTLIDWHATICNNDQTPGHWSSQYAAESSCLARHGQFTEWMASLDIDEYLVPLGNFTDFKSFLRHVSETEDTKIIKFPSSRGRLRFDSSFDVERHREKLSNVLFLEAYNCDTANVPKPSWAEVQRKEIYRTDYVHHHWVHYSIFTHLRAESYKEALPYGLMNTTARRRQPWKVLHWGYPDPLQRVVDETNEGVMVHAKTTKTYETENYKDMCHVNRTLKRECQVGFPWPNKSVASEQSPGDVGSFNGQGMMYNCFSYDKISNYWLPRLREAMALRKESFLRKKLGRSRM